MQYFKQLNKYQQTQSVCSQCSGCMCDNACDKSYEMEKVEDVKKTGDENEIFF